MKVICKLHLESSFDIYFLFIPFCQYPDTFWWQNFTAQKSLVSQQWSHHRRRQLDSGK